MKLIYGFYLFSSLGISLINNQNVLKNAESSLAALNNFFYYNQIGNVGFIGYSGAYSYVDTIKVRSFLL